MSREEAIEKLRTPIYTNDQIKEDFEFVSNKLGIKTEELWEYFNMPKKTFKNYKSQQSIYNIGASIMKYFGIEKGGKR
jgi:hypothetical protein